MVTTPAHRRPLIRDLQNVITVIDDHLSSRRHGAPIPVSIRDPLSLKTLCRDVITVLDSHADKMKAATDAIGFQRRLRLEELLNQIGPEEHATMHLLARFLNSRGFRVEPPRTIEPPK